MTVDQALEAFAEVQRRNIERWLKDYWEILLEDGEMPSDARDYVDAARQDLLADCAAVRQRARVLLHHMAKEWAAAGCPDREPFVLELEPGQCH